MAVMEEQLRQNEAAEEQGLEVDVTNQQPPRIQRPKTVVKALPIRTNGNAPKVLGKQTLGTCERCGYMSSQAICQACMLLEGLNKNRPQIQI